MFVLYYQECPPNGYTFIGKYDDYKEYQDLWYDIVRLHRLNPVDFETDQFFHSIVIDLLNYKKFQDDQIIIEYLRG